MNQILICTFVKCLLVSYCMVKHGANFKTVIKTITETTRIVFLGKNIRYRSRIIKKWVTNVCHYISCEKIKYISYFYTVTTRKKNRYWRLLSPTNILIVTPESIRVPYVGPWTPSRCSSSSCCCLAVIFLFTSSKHFIILCLFWPRKLTTLIKIAIVKNWCTILSLFHSTSYSELPQLSNEPN